MPNIVSVRFRGTGKTYHFDPRDLDLHIGDTVIVETAQGPSYGTIAEEISEMPEERLNAPLKPIIRIATADDQAWYEELRRRECEAFRTCQQRIASRDLDMNLVNAEYAFEGNKIVFYFTADGRVDFRELVKDLASTFRMRIELRQIGVRDEARMVGGLGICGRELCCCSFLSDFVPVSIKMAKAQNLSMNPNKISGACGRLLCCLKYEQEAYEDALSRLPRQGFIVMTPEGQGVVLNVDLIRENVTVRLDRGGDADEITVPGDQIEIIAGKQPRRNPGSQQQARAGERRVADPGGDARSDGAPAKDRRTRDKVEEPDDGPDTDG